MKAFAAFALVLLVPLAAEGSTFCEAPDWGSAYSPKKLNYNMGEFVSVHYEHPAADTIHYCNFAGEWQQWWHAAGIIVIYSGDMQVL